MGPLPRSRPSWAPGISTGFPPLLWDLILGDYIVTSCQKHRLGYSTHSEYNTYRKIWLRHHSVGNQEYIEACFAEGRKTQYRMWIYELRIITPNSLCYCHAYVSCTIHNSVIMKCLLLQLLRFISVIYHVRVSFSSPYWFSFYDAARYKQ